jgi:protoheme IX farnesyltransferase
MVTFSSLTGYILADKPDPYIITILSTGVMFLSSGSSALNQVQEQKTDSLMERTKKRPLPSKRISIYTALIISIALIFAGLILLSIISIIPALIGLITVILYNFIYTPLKRVSALSILPGALVGAVCPLIGWTAGGAAFFHPVALFIAIFIFLWQVPHFYLLLLLHRSDYQKAGFPEIHDFLKVPDIKKLVFSWIVFTSVFLFSYPFFQFSIRPILLPFFILINAALIVFFYRLLFDKRMAIPLRLAFALINSFAIFVLIFLITARY